MILGSKYFYRKIAEILLNRTPKNQAEVDEMNLKMYCANYECVMKGYGQSVRKTCFPTPSDNTTTQPTPWFAFTCRPISGSPGTNWKAMG